MTAPNDRERRIVADALWDADGDLNEYDIVRLLAAYRKELALKWTQVVPTVPGWYWLSGGTIDRVYECDGKLHLFSAGGEVEDWEGVSWAGPLPEPEDDQ